MTLLITGCGLLKTTPEQQPVKFSELEGWSQEQAIAVRPALVNSCQRPESFSADREKSLGELPAVAVSM